MNIKLELNSKWQWKLLQSQILSKQNSMYMDNFRNLDTYELVHVLVDERDQPVLKSGCKKDIPSYLIFTHEHLVGKIEFAVSIEDAHAQSNRVISSKKFKLKTIMLGELVSSLKTAKTPAKIKVNPVLVKYENEIGTYYLCEEVIFAPILDTLTGKLLICNPDDATALLAISSDDVTRFGIELVFYALTNKDLPEDKEGREKVLSEKLEELIFILPRTPIKKGSGTFLAILLNLDNEFEELTFIRNYNTFDPYADIVFVTSALKLLTGDLRPIPYHGEQVDGIFIPMIQWQNRKRQQFNLNI